MLDRGLLPFIVCSNDEPLLSLTYFTQVVINNSSSNSGDVMCGVPQGSILGPLLLLLFINDLPLSLKIPQYLDLYADDTTLIYFIQYCIR